MTEGDLSPDHNCSINWDLCLLDIKLCRQIEYVYLTLVFWPKTFHNPVMTCRQFAIYRRYINLEQLLTMENHSFSSIISFFDCNNLPFFITEFFNPKIILIAACNSEIIVIDHFERHQVQIDIFIQ